MWENAYLGIKNPKASRALKRALDPGRKLLASLARLRFATPATFGLNTWGPPLDQILDPHLRILNLPSLAKTPCCLCPRKSLCYLNLWLQLGYCVISCHNQLWERQNNRVIRSQ